MKNYGFKPDVIKPEDYVFGASSPIATPPINPGGQWDAYLPAIERQNINGVETYNCTGFGTLNCIEVLIKKQFDFNSDINYADRAVGIAAGTREGGNSPHVVAETIRKVACMVPEKNLPFSEAITSIEQYYSPDPLSETLVRIGTDWLNKFIFRHEWVFSTGDFENETIAQKQQKMRAALEHSPLGVSVYAWPDQDEQGIYRKEKGMTDNHWVMCYGYVEGQYWKIYDHYDNEHKKLAWDYDFAFAKRYSISGRPASKASSFWARLVSALAKIKTFLHL